MKSNIMKAIDDQKNIDLFVDRGTNLLPHHLIENCSNYVDALNLTLASSPIQDQQLAYEVGMDQAILSRMRTGQVHAINPKLERILKGSGNVGVLQKAALDCGLGLVRLQTEIEVENARLRQELEEERRKMIYVAEFMGKVKS